MKKSSVISLLTILFIISFLMITCKHEIPVPLTPPDTGTGTDTTTIPDVNTCSPDSVYFVNTILPLINSGCASTGCHDAVSRAEGVVLTDYSSILRYVRAGNAANSKLYKEIIRTDNERMPPPPRPAFTTDEKAAIQKWINQGALNNQCTEGCDPSVFNYGSIISATMNTYCKGCHNPSSLGGGVDLSSYATIKAQALNGNLIGTITHASGHIPMPQGSGKLSDCKISQVQKWIDAGTPNN